VTTGFVLVGQKKKIFTTSGKETERVYSYNPGACMGHTDADVLAATTAITAGCCCC